MRDPRVLRMMVKPYLLKPDLRVGTFAEKFVQESARIENQDIPADKLADSGHMAAYDDMLEHAMGTEPLREADIKNWQKQIAGEQHNWGDMRMATDELGAYRQHRIWIGGMSEEAKEIGSPFQSIYADMADLVAIANAVGPDPLADAAYLHWRYERIHPFADGNGRSGRLLALWYLRRMNHAPVLFTHADRGANYYPCFPEKTPQLMVEYFRIHQVDDWE